MAVNVSGFTMSYRENLLMHLVSYKRKKGKTQCLEAKTRQIQ